VGRESVEAESPWLTDTSRVNCVSGISTLAVGVPSAVGDSFNSLFWYSDSGCSAPGLGCGDNVWTRKLSSDALFASSLASNDSFLAAGAGTRPNRRECVVDGKPALDDSRGDDRLTGCCGDAGM
jgi:hypothetical protein